MCFHSREVPGAVKFTETDSRRGLRGGRPGQGVTKGYRRSFRWKTRRLAQRRPSLPLPTHHHHLAAGQPVLGKASQTSTRAHAPALLSCVASGKPLHPPEPQSLSTKSG